MKMFKYNDEVVVTGGNYVHTKKGMHGTVREVHRLSCNVKFKQGIYNIGKEFLMSKEEYKEAQATKKKEAKQKKPHANKMVEPKEQGMENK